MTDKGFSITQDLYDMLKSVFADQVANTSNGNQFDCSSTEKVDNMIYAITGGYLDDGRLKSIVENGYLLNIVKDSNYFKIFVCEPSYTFFVHPDYSYSPPLYCLWRKDSLGRTKKFSTGGSSVNITDHTTHYDMTISAWSSDYQWVIQNGAFVGTDTIGAQVSEGACPAEVPEVVPWRKEVTVPDEWRVIPGGGSDDDPDKNPDALPVVIPIKPTPGKDPDSTEDPSTETPEDPDKKDDPDKKKDPVVNPIINPDTGNVVDPNTGWDIDPSTGMLINPNTGELVNPDTSNTVSNASKFGDITKLFPFCIPFDLVKLIKGMSAEKAPPVFHFEHKFKGINYTFVVDVDLSDYDKYIKVFRFGLQVIFVITLMFLTVKFSKLFS